MIPNCRGCQNELCEIERNSELHFAGKGLYEKGHLILIMVNDKGEVIIE